MKIIKGTSPPASAVHQGWMIFIAIANPVGIMDAFVDNLDYCLRITCFTVDFPVYPVSYRC